MVRLLQGKKTELICLSDLFILQNPVIPRLVRFSLHSTKMLAEGYMISQSCNITELVLYTVNLP